MLSPSDLKAFRSLIKDSELGEFSKKLLFYLLVCSENLTENVCAICNEESREPSKRVTEAYHEIHNLNASENKEHINAFPALLNHEPKLFISTLPGDYNKTGQFRRDHKEIDPEAAYVCCAVWLSPKHFNPVATAFFITADEVDAIKLN